MSTLGGKGLNFCFIRKRLSYQSPLPKSKRREAIHGHSWSSLVRDAARNTLLWLRLCEVLNKVLYLLRFWNLWLSIEDVERDMTVFQYSPWEVASRCLYWVACCVYISADRYFNNNSAVAPGYSINGVGEGKQRR